MGNIHNSDSIRLFPPFQMMQFMFRERLSHSPKFSKLVSDRPVLRFQLDFTVHFNLYLCWLPVKPPMSEADGYYTFFDF